MSETVAREFPAFPFARPADDPFNPPPSRDGAAVCKVALPTGRWAWLVTGHDDVRQMLRNPAFSADLTRPGFPLLRAVPPQRPVDRAGMFIRMDAPDHTRLRRIVTPEFMIRNMRRLEPLVQRTVAETLDGLAAAGPPADLVEHFALPVPSKVICHLLGVPYADHAFFQVRSRTLIGRAGSPDEVRRAANELRGYLGELVETRQRAGGSDDLVGRLAVQRVATGQLGADEVVGVAMLLLIAGHETTANMIGLSTLLLLEQHPATFAALPGDPALLASTVEELLRFLTIVRTGLPRAVVADVELGGQRMHAGDGAIAMLSTANRDADVFAAAERFDPRRGADQHGSNQHLAFGFGVHQCVGQPLARVELRYALAELARRFPRLRLAVAPEEVQLRDDSVVYGVDRMPVTW
jgi:cytochrome P450